MDNQDILNRIKMGILQKDIGARLFLYGSRARGDYRDDSDWDILVITSREIITLDFELELRDPIVDIELETGQVIGLVVYTSKDWESKLLYSPLFNNVNKEGIRI